MTPSGGKRKGAGRPARNNTKRHGIIINNDLYAFLEQYGSYTNKRGKLTMNASQGIERLAENSEDYRKWLEQRKPKQEGGEE